MTGPPRAYDLIIFDLDGVITTEHIYWECARLTLWELLYLRLSAGGGYVNAVHDWAAREQILPQSLVFAVKNRAVNSNWDLTFVAACALLGSLETAVNGADTVDGILRALRRRGRRPAPWPEAVCNLLEAGDGGQGAALVAFAGRWASQKIGAPQALFLPGGPWWRYLYERFQLWYDGPLMGLWGAAPLQEKPVLPVERIRDVLLRLRAAGCELGVATGRPRGEALRALRSFGVLDCFAAERVVTHTEVEAAQRQHGGEPLGKPHPFAIWRALWPDVETSALLRERWPESNIRALVVGDAPSDALAARAAGLSCLGVLSGVIGDGQARQARRAALQEAGCVAVLDDLTEIPAWLSTL
ncbi:MAG: hypothetical protein Kow0063_02590 [Anaerolineae bacterium]